MRALRLTVILCATVVFGLTLAHVLQSPGSRGLPAHAWLQVQHTFYGGFAIVGGVAEIVGLVCAAALAVLLWRRRGGAGVRRWAWAGPAVAGAALCGTLVAYWVGNRPVNAKIAGWTDATIPPDWSSSRALWENAHAVSAVLGLLALLAMVVPLVWHSGAPEPAAADADRAPS